MDMIANSPASVKSSKAEGAAKANALGTLATPVRVASIDLFRGMDMLLMIFVNNVSEVRGLPWWTYHRGDVDGMTYVDMVFPAFLFLMGMSIPLSMDARAAKGESKARMWWHVVTRSLSLVVMGLFIANAANVDARHTHLSQTWWTALGFAGIALAWARLPGEGKAKTLYRTLRYAGLALIAVLFVLFRRVTPDGEVAGLDFSYVEILGLLGWAYLFAGGLYLLVGKKFRVLGGVFAALVAVNAFTTLGWVNLNAGPLRWNPFEAGLSSLALAGVLASLVIAGKTVAEKFGQKAALLCGGAAVVFGVGYALEPLGISKNRDTPTWCLYCTGANLLIALLLYWIADVKGWRKWGSFAKLVGENPLLTYLLAYVPFLVRPLRGLSTFGLWGWWGVVKSALLAALMLVLTKVLVRWGVRLRV